MSKQAVWIEIEGRVQGVGYRYYLKNLALLSGIQGYVRNTVEGHVQAHIEGNEQQLGPFIAAAKHGPARAIVTRFAAEEVAVVGYEGFEIR